VTTQMTLEISLYGPFGVRVCERFVRVYAPKCEDHFAFIQTDRLDQAINGEYLVKAAVSDCTQAGCHNPNELIFVNWLRCKEPQGPTPGQCDLVVDLPLPDEVIGLAPDSVIITQFDIPGAKPVTQPVATALRFIYSGFNSNVGLQLYSKANGQLVVDTGAYPPLPALQQHVSVAFHYVSKTLTDSHKDAQDCFRRLRDLFPPLGAWRAEYPDISAGEAKVKIAHVTNDCRAQLIVFATVDERKFLHGDRPHDAASSD
jgi:hypothetical protein